LLHQECRETGEHSFLAIVNKSECTLVTILRLISRFPVCTRTFSMSVTIHTTAGDLKLEIFCDTAPRTSFNFLALCSSGAYDGTIFHRNIKGFMIQGTLSYK
jgi:hypothetical protein